MCICSRLDLINQLLLFRCRRPLSLSALDSLFCVLSFPASTNVYNEYKYDVFLTTHMVSGQYFNKGVKALNSPDVGHVVRETEDKVIVFGEANTRYDIPKSAIKFVSGNVLVDMSITDIVQKYKVNRDAPIPETAEDSAEKAGDADLATYEKKYPKSFFNKGVRSKNEDNVGHVTKETDSTIVVFGERDIRYDIPKSKIIAVGRNIILGMDYPEISKYMVDKNAPLPSG